jgi:hypothetical protein
MPFRALIQRLRPTTPEQQLALEVYRHQTSALVARASHMRDEWLSLSQLEPDSERLANIAAVNRWELARLHEQHEQEAAPRLAAGQQQTVLAALADLARAFQLLANGHRFHKSDAVCDGQVLLVETVDRLTAVQQRLAALQPRVAAAGGS